MLKVVPVAALSVAVNRLALKAQGPSAVAAVRTTGNWASEGLDWPQPQRLMMAPVTTAVRRSKEKGQALQPTSSNQLAVDFCTRMNGRFSACTFVPFPPTPIV
jgi:D-aminopeptidase